MNNSEFRILIVDDEIFNIDVIIGFLEDKHYKFNYTTNGKDALKALFSKKFDLILLDINMPTMDGFEVCRRIKNDDSTKEIPIIFLSAYHDEKSISTAFSLGAVDYIRKPFNGLELIARVDTHIQMRKYIRELKEKQEKLAIIASTDLQTGLPNRLRFAAVLKKECSAITTNPSRLTLAYVKIDHLQKLNNMFGHKNTDKILIKVAKILQDNIKNRCIVTRLFSSDFVILMPNISLEAATYLVKKIYTQISKMNFSGINITCSIGLTEYIFGEAQYIFMLRAEKIMDKIQKNGGNMILNKTYYD